MSLNSKASYGIQDGDIIAAVDMGSNSFHMVIAKLDNGEIRTIEKIGEKVQLAAGMQGGIITNEALERGEACLLRFAERLASLPSCVLRAVSTNTLRAAKNAKPFVREAEKILGVPIEIISGREEARLVYLGVAHTLADDGESRLVIDIGGGSTECVIGERFESKQMESLHMGCVSYMRYYPNGEISAQNFARAYNTAYLELLNICDSYRGRWQNCVGSSGTLLAIEQVMICNGLSAEGINREGLQRLKSLLLEFSHNDDVQFQGLKESRRRIFASGVAITLALFDALNIEHMSLSDGALREGVLYDLIGRYGHEDVRERTVTALEQRYDVNPELGQTVAAITDTLFEQVAEDWKLGEEDRRLLSWAARLHALGLSVSHHQFHKHGEYLIRVSDLAGFSRQNQEELALLVRSHRRKIPLALYDELSKNSRKRLLRLAILLRAAVLLKHTSNVDGIPDLRLDTTGKYAVQLEFPDGWLEEHPLTAYEFSQEQDLLNRAEIELLVS